ncbi:hypothetical protein ACIBQX_11265 [Nonomuraea sp. NPDC049714]|uniref:hypothetical protein n=1 Tax=Nonomuraea sp. NPDC049714 TaxID=3364357 RepID=UPI00379E3CE1
MMRIFQNSLSVGLNAYKDLYREVVGLNMLPEYTPRHLVIVQNFSEGPVYLGGEMNMTANPGGLADAGYVLAAGAEFRLEMSHFRLWAHNPGSQVLSGIRVLIVVH